MEFKCIDIVNLIIDLFLAENKMAPILFFNGSNFAQKKKKKKKYTRSLMNTQFLVKILIVYDRKL